MLSELEQAATNALDSSRIALIEACENFRPGQGAIVRNLMGGKLCEEIEARFAGLLLDARLGLETPDAAIRAVPLADFADAAVAIEATARAGIVAVDGTIPYPEMVAAIVRETVARCFGPAASALAVDTTPPRPLMVPCPHCPDGFTSAGDRHARTRMDVCGACGGTHQVPARTGETPEASAQP